MWLARLVVDPLVYSLVPRLLFIDVKNAVRERDYYRRRLFRSTFPNTSEKQDNVHIISQYNPQYGCASLVENLSSVKYLVINGSIA